MKAYFTHALKEHNKNDTSSKKKRGGVVLMVCTHDIANSRSINQKMMKRDGERTSMPIFKSIMTG